jgi:hypothetical protein
MTTYTLDKRKRAPTSGTMDIHALASGTAVAADFLAFSDESASGDPTKRMTVANVIAISAVLKDTFVLSGDILVGTGLGTYTAVTLGAANTIMYSNGTNPTYGTASTINAILDPTRTLVLTAAGGHGTTTSGAGDATGLPEQGETTTNKINYWYLAMAVGEKAFWEVDMPGAYDGSTAMEVYFIWTAASGSAGHTCKFQIKSRCFANDEAYDQACGSAVSGEDALLAQGDRHVIQATGDMTPGGTPAGGEGIYFEVERIASSGTEIAGDVQLQRVVLKYATTSNSD